MEVLSRQYIVKGNKVITLYKSSDGLWSDKDGCVYAIRDLKAVDNIDRAGIGIFSLPSAHELSKLAVPHDYAYTSLAYQVYNTRKQADEMLRRNLKAFGWPVTAQIFYHLSRIFGRFFWENSKTNN